MKKTAATNYAFTISSLQLGLEWNAPASKPMADCFKAR